MGSEANIQVFAHPAREAGGWRLHEVDVTSSTNDLARTLPPWSAVRANRQTAGRGRHQRSWVSDEGGLWLSAVVPTGEAGQSWAALPLAAGLAVCEVLFGLGVHPLHLRWPNDVMIGRRKLAGLLIDQFEPGRAVIGMGINVHNEPSTRDAALAGRVARIADVPAVGPVPSLSELGFRILGGIGEVVRVMHRAGFAALVPRMNRWWPVELAVELETESGTWAGMFAGVDAGGRVRVRSADGRIDDFHAHQVIRLREAENDP